MEKQQQLIISQNKPLLTVPTQDQASSSCNNLRNNIDDDLNLFSFPPGYRFHPSDEELIVEYLMKRVNNQELPPNRIHVVDLYQHNPDTLAEQYESSTGEQVWYFFTPRTRKYRNGDRPNRAAGDGYWKATGADKPVKVNGTEVGSRKALVHYVGKPPNGVKSSWIMHEYMVKTSLQRQRDQNNEMRLDDWVLCRIYKKSDRTTNTRNDDSQTHSETVMSQPPNGFPSIMSDFRNLSSPIQIPRANEFPSMMSEYSPSTGCSTPDQTPHAPNGFPTTSSDNNLSSGLSTPADQAQTPRANGIPSMMSENCQYTWMLNGYSLPVNPAEDHHHNYSAALSNVFGEVALSHSLPSHYSDYQPSSMGGLSNQGTDSCVDAENLELATIFAMDQYINYDGSLPDNL